MTPRRLRTPAERMLGYARVKEARDRRTTADRLRELASDEITPVRLYTAMNFATPPDALLRLSRDEEYHLRWCVLLNPAADEAVLRSMVVQERVEAANLRGGPPAYFVGGFFVRGHAVHHPGASAALRAELLAEGVCGCPGKCDNQQVWQTRMARVRAAGWP
ncbi:hypothetical protein ACFYM0_01690 [Streptomyces sp. NPDC006487]|uniref:hypothetical protein n=1 Tax=Streptomyces sp. NPDC006487 TaxID=3364748 RepID=UPI003692CCB3